MNTSFYIYIYTKWCKKLITWLRRKQQSQPKGSALLIVLEKHFNRIWVHKWLLVEAAPAAEDKYHVLNVYYYR